MQEGRTFAGAAFSKTLLNYLISVVVGHGATHRRRSSDGAGRRGGWSGSASWRTAIQPDGIGCQAVLMF
jgi:hypothetical protein